MNWKRIFIFVLVLWLATFGASFPFGFVIGYLTVRQTPVPVWLALGQMLAVLVAAAAVFYVLARRQGNRPWLHALIVAVISWLVSFPVNVLALGQPVVTWGYSPFFLLASLSAGVSLASSLRKGNKEGQ